MSLYRFAVVYRALAVARGGALAGALAGIAFSGALVTGVVAAGSRFVFLGVAVAGAIYWLLPQTEMKTCLALGSLLVALTAAGIGLATGFGALEVSGVIGGVAGALPGKRLARLFRVRPSTIGLIGIGVVAVGLAGLVVDGGTLGHDEAAYALKGKSWLQGTPDSGWSLHRAPALSAYAYLALAVGGSEAALRVLGFAATVGFAGATWWLASVVGMKNRAGPIAGLGLLGSPAILRRGTEFLSDIPSAALLLVLMAMIWAEFNAEYRPSYRMLWTLPVAWLAFYVRYQSSLTLVLIGIAAFILWWDRIKRRPGPIVATAILGFVGLVPHFVYSISKTGSPLGILLTTSQAGGREFLGEGLVDYAGLMLWSLGGFVGPIAAILFMWWAIASWKDHASRRRALFLLIPAVGQVVVLGVISHGEARFIFFSLALTIIGGSMGFIELSSQWTAKAKRAAALGLALLVMGSIALSVASARRSVEGRIASNEAVELAALAVQDMDTGEPCGVMTSYLPQVTFYSGCWTDRFRTNLLPDRAVGRLRGDEKFIVLIEEGKRQPTGEALQGLLDKAIGGEIEIDGRGRDASIYQLAP